MSGPPDVAATMQPLNAQREATAPDHFGPEVGAPASNDLLDSLVRSAAHG